jgi:hypothetical protein
VPVLDQGRGHHTDAATLTLDQPPRFVAGKQLGG